MVCGEDPDTTLPQAPAVAPVPATQPEAPHSTTAEAAPDQLTDAVVALVNVIETELGKVHAGGAGGTKVYVKPVAGLTVFDKVSVLALVAPAVLADHEVVEVLLLKSALELPLNPTWY